MNELEQARLQIDAADSEIARLFEQRMAAVQKVVAYKQAHGLPVLDAARENAVLEKNLARLQTPALAPYFCDFLQHEMAISRQYQRWLLGQDTVAYQGVEGAFSHMALLRLFPHAQAKAYATWDEVFDAVEKQDAAFGVVPFENSHAGDVSAVLDLCYAHKLYITDVCDLTVEQHLLGLPGAQLGGVREVYSHQQAIAQSEQFLRTLGLPSHAMANTALAAKYVAEQGDLSKAAIASETTAELYGLQILARCINTDGDNTTRFIVVGKNLPTAGNRFSLLFTVDHKAGQLARVIQAIGAAGFNMESIKSRPMPHVPFEYYFYVELVGNVQTPDTKALLDSLSDICRTVRLLGVYSRSNAQ